MEGQTNDAKAKDGVELKGGHEPAKMVGGRRIVTRERHSESEDKAPPKKTAEQSEEDKEEFGEDKPIKAASVSLTYIFYKFGIIYRLKFRVQGV